MNDDDDNRNQIPDLQESGPPEGVPGEDDTAAVGATVEDGGANLAGFELSLELTAGAGLVEVWQDAEKLVAVALGTAHPIGVLPSTVYVEGLQPGYARLELVLRDAMGAEIHRDKAGFVAARVVLASPGDTNDDSILNDDATAANSYTGNEFTFSDADPGILTTPVRVEVTPDDENIRTLFAGRIVVDVGAIGDSHLPMGPYFTSLAWDSPVGADPSRGTAVYGQDPAAPTSWTATATFTGLPRNNDDFGVKTSTATVGPIGSTAQMKKRADYEVFFPRDQSNHPDLPGKEDLGNFSATRDDTVGRGDSERSPNWFFYWQQTTAGDPDARYDSTLPTAAFAQGAAGFTPAGGQWTAYAGPRERILITTASSTFVRQIGFSNRTGIDAFANLVAHENRHVQQILEHNALGPYDVSQPDGSRVGWSLLHEGAAIGRTRQDVQAGLYNHFSPGPDGKPGVAGVDDDMDGTVDEFDEFIAGAPAGQLVAGQAVVVGDDIDLDPDGDLWGAVPTGPDPQPNTPNAVSGQGGWIEAQAVQAENVQENSLKHKDWGNPGKQHGGSSFSD